MKTARNRAVQWTRNLKAREAAKRFGRRCRAYASRFLVRHEGGLHADHKPVWRTKQFTEPGYVKPNVVKVNRFTENETITIPTDAAAERQRDKQAGGQVDDPLAIPAFLDRRTKA